MTELGTIVPKGIDPEGHEILEHLTAIRPCPDCGQLTELWSRSNQWIVKECSTYHYHAGYGPAMGDCTDCGTSLILDRHGHISVFLWKEG